MIKKIVQKLKYSLPLNGRSWKSSPLVSLFLGEGKESGMSLLLAILLSGAVLAIGATASQLLVYSLRITVETKQAEQAYYSAESGIETALLELKNHPSQHWLGANFSEGRVGYRRDMIAQIRPKVGGLIPTEFGFSLNPLEIRQFRFVYDSDGSDLVNLVSPARANLKVVSETAGVVPKYQWRFSCLDSGGVTQSLEGVINVSVSKDLVATYGDTPNERFSSWRSGIEADTCFLTLENLGDQAATFTFSGSQLAPDTTKITVVGQAGNQQKRVSFNYAQKNIGSLFNFLLFHVEGGVGG